MCGDGVCLFPHHEIPAFGMPTGTPGAAGRLWAGDDEMNRETGCWGGAGDGGGGVQTSSPCPSSRCFRGACRDILLLGKRHGLSL